MKNFLCSKDFAECICLLYSDNSNEVFSIIPISQMKKICHLFFEIVKKVTK